MPYRLLADTVLLLHLAFVVFVVGGALLTWRWPRLVWAHLPAAGWGAMIEITGGVCPLTTLENHLRQASGEAGFERSLIDRILMPMLYPDGLTRELQVALGAAVVLVNLLAYAWLRARRKRATPH